ncbi:uncharacterized protein [Eleutherodactylus coqui]|uniref:uncharacterized protein n=1 Tax=Eleutherodactylus coqui TaxID=57060 RepID=UPI003462DD60
MSASVEDLLAKIRAEALVRGVDWLRETMAEALEDKGAAADTEDAQPCAKRVRPLEHRSPSPVPRTRCRVSSPDRDPPGAATGQCPASEGLHPGRNLFRSDSDLNTVNEAHDEDLRTSTDAPLQRDADSGPSNAVAVTVSVVDDESNDDQNYTSPLADSQPDQELAAQLPGNGSSGRVPITAHANRTVKEPDAVRIERLLQSCSAAASLDQQHAPKPVSRSAPDLRACLVWILGNSFVTSAFERVSQLPDGRQLGFPLSKAIIRWLGLNILPWASVRATVARYSEQYRPPDVLVVHTGENDLGTIPIKHLIEYIKFDMLRLRSIFPGAVIVWSEIIKRRKWLHAKSRKGLDRARIKVNQAASKYLAENGVVVIRHRRLEGDSAHLFEEDGVNLNSAGNDEWCNEIREGIDKALQLWKQSHGITPNHVM